MKKIIQIIMMIINKLKIYIILSIVFFILLLVYFIFFKGSGITPFSYF